MKTKIALRYENAIVLGPSTSLVGTYGNDNAVASICADMMQLGFIPSEGLLHELRRVNDEVKLGVIYNDLIPELKRMVGADVEYAPMYPNFPKQVMEASDAELYLNAIVHYLSFGQWTPDYEKLPRDVAFERTQFKEIGVITNEQFNAIFTRLLESNDSISVGDKKTVEWFIENCSHLDIPNQIPFKENMCVVAGMFLNKDRNVRPLIKTATDVLRIAAYLSEGDVSLAEPTKFKSLPRRHRRQLVNALAEVATEEDIARFRNRWIKLFHNLHVGDFSAKVYNLAKKVRDNEKIPTFNGRVQDALDKGNLNKIVELLEQRPGEFARRLDHVLRIAGRHRAPVSEQRRVVQHFLDVADCVSTRVLLQVLGHFEQRDDNQQQRIVFPKGMVQRAVVLDQEIKALSTTVTNLITDGVVEVLLNRFSNGDDLNKVWIDPLLAQCPVPTQMRSASEGLHQVARGTRLPFGDETKTTLRFFIHWIGRDIDLSATMHDENFKMIGEVAYFNLREDGAYHSGDIVNAPGPEGASEFIDVNINKARKMGARYVAMNVYVFSGPTFAEHEQVYAGWMTRSKPNSNEVYDPKTVEQKIDLTAQTRNAIPVLFDLEERTAIWVDLTFAGRGSWLAPAGRVGIFGPNDVRANRASVEQTVQAIVDMSNKVSLYELFALHTAARGVLVTDRNDADVVFGVDQDADVTPYNIDVINSEFVV